MGALVLAWLSGEPASARTRQETRAAAPKPIVFQDDLASALAAAKQSGKPVVVIFHARWCQPCRTFEANTLRSAEIKSLAPSFHWVYVDIDRDVGLAREYDVNATPTSVILRPDGTKITSAAGAFPPSTFRSFLESTLKTEATAETLVPGHEGADPTQLTWSPSGYRARAICFSQIGYGPLSLPSQAPAQILRLGLQPRTPSTLADGQFELNWTESVANIFNFEENDFRLDYMTINSTVSVAYGLSDSVEVDLAVGNLSRTYRYLDGITNAFHDLFGLDDAGRDDFPENDNIIDLEPQNGVEIEDTSTGSESTHVTLTLQHNLTCGTTVWPALAYSVSTRWDAGGHADLEGSSDFSFGVSGSAARRLGEKFYAYLGAGYNWYGPDESRGLPLKDEQWGGLAALEWSYKPTRSLVLQYLVNEGAAVDRDPFDKITHEVHFGWKGEIRTGTVLEIGLIENIINADNSPDFGLHFGLRFRF